jgi:hypothetical protein
LRGGCILAPLQARYASVAPVVAGEVL